MPRAPKGWWDARRGRYLARLGPESERTGKPTPVVLEHPDGRPIAKGDAAAVAAAILRLQAERDARERRFAGPSVIELAREFVRWHEDNGSAPKTCDGHQYYLTRFARFVGPDGLPYGVRAAASIGPEDLWRIKASGQGSLRLWFASVLACWRWASRPVEGRTPARLLASNPLEGVAKPPRGRTTPKLVDWPTTRRLLRIARAWANEPIPKRQARIRAERRLRVLCLTLIAWTGCRPFEAGGLRWDEIDWREGVIVVDPARTKRRGKDRRIALPRQLGRALQLARWSTSAHPVFAFLPAWSRGTRGLGVHGLDEWFRETLKPLATAAGVPLPEGLTLYWFRHDWQTAGLDVASVEQVSAAAGNSPGVLVSTYAHLRNEGIRKTAEAVQRRRRG